ncbi:Origin recognition complex, subunit 1 [Serendipita sp. 400]|nr:Origin recognition complex, subunit 1 [Serendipita sp. 400]
MRLTRSQQTTEVDAKIAAHSTYIRGGDLPQRTTLYDDLLPSERVELANEAHDTLSNYVTTPFTEITRKSKNKSMSQSLFRVGETVEIKSAHSPKPMVAVIVSFHEISHKDGAEEDENLLGSRISPLKAIVHRFELAGSTAVHRIVRPYVKNEVYYLVKDVLSTDISSILRHCKVSQKVDESPNHVASSEYVIDSAYDPTTGLYFPIRWDEFLRDKTTTHQADRIAQWNISTHGLLSSISHRGAQHDSSSSENSGHDDEATMSEDDDDDDDNDEVVSEGEQMEEEELDEIHADSDDSEAGGIKGSNKKNKRKRRNDTDTTRTPKRQKRVTRPTPHSKAALKARRKFKIRPPTVTKQDNSTLYAMEDDPFLRAMYTLHVGERPDTLPCRDDEYVTIFENVLGLLQETSGGCIYISGVPGTGKTATVHTIIRELKIMASNNECNPFTFVEINGLRVPEPSAAYPLLWEAIVGHDASVHGHLRVGPKEALRNLIVHFGLGSSENSGPACIVLMDELDQLVTTKQDVVYNFFNWPNLPGSKLIVLAVANTHDLPERTLNAKVRSRLGMIRINFAPYTKIQLVEIVNTRLNRAREGASSTRAVIKPDAILYAATRVGGVSGDARRVLDICRRTIERVHSKGREATIPDIMQVISLTQNTPTAGYIAQCSYHEKTMLAAALMEIRWTGVEEFTWEKLRSRHLGLFQQLNTHDDAPRRTPSEEQLSSVLDTLVSAGLLSVESGAMANRKALSDRKVVMTVEKQEVKRVLVETNQRWHAILGIDA